MNGILIINKPKGITSHDVVARIRRIVGRGLKVGHGGTLDPLATGVLPILIGTATKLSSQIMQGDKEYIADIKFGETTDTDDADGEIISKGEVPSDLKGRLLSILPDFIGNIAQVAPKYSAIKQNGRPLYKIARKGENFTPPTREISVYEIELLECSQSIAKMRIKCQKGTYIRSLARDIGAKLGCGGHVKELKRTLCGDLSIGDAVALSKVFTGQDIELMLRAATLYGITTNKKNGAHEKT